MEKDLLRIRYINKDVCEISANIDNEEDGEQLAAAILGILARDNGPLQAAILSAVFCYMETDKEELGAIAHRDMQPVIIKANDTVS